MTIKKIAMTAGAAALLMASAVPAFASYDHYMNFGTSVSNRGDVSNLSVNLANTGFNRASGWHSAVFTGNASAIQVTTNEILTTSNCGCVTGRHGSLTVSNRGDINNASINVANTGVNGGGFVHTGDAYAGQDVLNVINTSVGDTAM